MADHAQGPQAGHQRPEVLEVGPDHPDDVVAQPSQLVFPAYWGNEDTDRWWFSEIERLAAPPRSGGSTDLLSLSRAPAVVLIFAAGVAATAAVRWDLVGRLLVEPTTRESYVGKTVRVADQLGPETFGPSSKYLCELLRPMIAGHLGVGSAYDDAWQRFEYLRLMSATCTAAAAHPGASAPIGLPHLQITDVGRHDYVPVASEWFQRFMGSDGKAHPLLEAGVAGGDYSFMMRSAALLDERLKFEANRNVSWVVRPGG